MAFKVKLRKKPISDDRQSLYLDIYPPMPHPTEKGKTTRRKFLGMYLFEKTKNPLDKQHNKETLRTAEQIRQKFENELNKPEVYTGYELEQLRLKERAETSFIDYFKKLADKRRTSNHDNWISAYNYLLQFTDGELLFAEVDEQFCEDFKEFLLSTKSRKSAGRKLSTNTAASYFNKLKAALKQAFKDGYLSSDLNSKVERIEEQEVIKQTLTLEELKLLANTETSNPRMKNAALFSALTGMPFKEMQNLTWGQIETSELFGIRIQMIRQKTGRPYRINISQEAYSLLGDPSSPDDPVFDGLNDRDRYYFFPLWLAEAGVKKKMTFHDLRHTYGCLQVDLGTDIYTLQGNMGHASPRQTMLYGKISDMRKREAADRIKLDIG